MYLSNGNTSVLVVDDEEPIRTSVGRYLTQLGYTVRVAGTGAEALDILQHDRTACLLLDITLPDVSGMELLTSVADVDPTVAIVMLTGRADARTATLCMQRGVMDFVTKPFDLSALGQAVDRALRSRAEMVAAQQMNRWLREEVALRNQAIEDERQKLQRLARAALEALVYAMEAKDGFLAGHSIRVAQLGASLAAELGRSEEEVEQVRTAGRLHDIGMIGISSRPLGKPGRLTREEFEQVKRHPVVGHQILTTYPHLGTVANFVRSHHERWDGKGYPDGLAGDDVPWGGRVLAGAEIYDALTTARPYREKMTPEDAREAMRSLAGQVLDPAVFEALVAVIGRHHALEFVDTDRGPHGERVLALAEAKPAGTGA